MSCLCSSLAFSQSKNTAQINQSIDLNIPSNVQLTPSKVREILKDINNKTEIKPTGYVAPAVSSAILKADIDNVLQAGFGGFSRNPKIKILNVKNAISYDVSVSKDINFSNGFSFIVIPNNVKDYRSYLQLNALDTNAVYYYRYRGRSGAVMGAWSDAKRFDTYPVPPFNVKSIFDLPQYVPNMFQSYGSHNAGLSVNTVYPIPVRVNDKLVYRQLFSGVANVLPKTIGLEVGTLLEVLETSCPATFVWGSSPYAIDIAPSLSVSGGSFILGIPSTTFPIDSINYFSNTFYTK